MEGWHLWHACRAALLERLGERDPALAAYGRALACDPSPEEAAFLRERAARA